MHRAEPVLIKQDKPLWIYYLHGLTLLPIQMDIQGQNGGEQLYGLLETLQVPQRLYEWAKDAEAVGDQESKASHEQMYNAVISFIDEISMVMKDEVLTLDEMMLLLEEGLSDVNYSMIPPSLDHVVITTIERGIVNGGLRCSSWASIKAYSHKAWAMKVLLRIRNAKS